MSIDKASKRVTRNIEALQELPLFSPGLVATQDTPGEQMAAQINWLNATSSWGKEVAEHPSTSAHALMELAAHADVEVRTAVADHKNTPLETVMMLAQDESADLRYAIAENHNVHADVLSMLAHDENPFVAHRAQKTLERLRSPLIATNDSRSDNKCNGQNLARIYCCKREPRFSTGNLKRLLNGGIQALKQHRPTLFYALPNPCRPPWQ